MHFERDKNVPSSSESSFLFFFLLFGPSQMKQKRCEKIAGALWKTEKDTLFQILAEIEKVSERDKQTERQDRTRHLQNERAYCKRERQSWQIKRQTEIQTFRQDCGRV